MEAAKLLVPNARARAKIPVVHAAEEDHTPAIVVAVRGGFRGQLPVTVKKRGTILTDLRALTVFHTVILFMTAAADVAAGAKTPALHAVDKVRLYVISAVVMVGSIAPHVEQLAE
jgi:hypothetical protein